MAFLGGKAQSGELGIVDHETAFEQAMIVIAGERGQAERHRMQAGGFRCQVGQAMTIGRARPSSADHVCV
jgi:hypothetical protein